MKANARSLRYINARLDAIESEVDTLADLPEEHLTLSLVNAVQRAEGKLYTVLNEIRDELRRVA